MLSSAPRGTRTGGTLGPQNFTGFDDADDVPSQAGSTRDPGSSVAQTDSRSASPAAARSSRELRAEPRWVERSALHTRHSASFTLSPLHCGSDYKSRGRKPADTANWDTCRPPIPGSAGRRAHVGAGRSVSGAAASPNMGYHTSPVVAFLLTVFNMRLGWWFPRPAHGGSRSVAVSALEPSVPVRRALRRRDGQVAIPDDLRRRPFRESRRLRADQAPLRTDHRQRRGVRSRPGVRRARHADPRVRGGLPHDDPNRRAIAAAAQGSPTGAAQRCAVGRIVYPEGLRGHARLPEGVDDRTRGHGESCSTRRAIRRSRTSRPAISSIAEDQFESYRALGYDIAGKAFEAPWRRSACTGPQLDDCARRRAQEDARPQPHPRRPLYGPRRGLIELWDKIREDPDLETLDMGLLKGGLPPGRALSRAEFYACVEMIQLMENVYIDLHLEETWDHADNRGWRRALRPVGRPAAAEGDVEGHLRRCSASGSVLLPAASWAMRDGRRRAVVVTAPAPSGWQPFARDVGGRHLARRAIVDHVVVGQD